MVLGIPPHSHSYFPLSRSLILITLPFTPLTLIPLYYIQARYSSVAALGSLVYQQTEPAVALPVFIFVITRPFLVFGVFVGLFMGVRRDFFWEGSFWRNRAILRPF